MNSGQNVPSEALQTAKATKSGQSATQTGEQELSLLGRRWSWPALPVPLLREQAADAAKQVPDWLTPILAARGITDAQKQALFLAPSLRALADPAGIADMQPAIERILLAQKRNERITIYGDYDVDGVVSSAVLLEFFAAAQMQADFYIPDRRAEGYGLNADAVARLAGSCDLLLTVDCGSTSHAEIAVAKAHGLDVIVIDHHQVGASLPEALALLNPHRPDCAFADKDLCAAGVAFMLVVALRRAMREQAPESPGALMDVRCLLDMVAVATVADMVPLQGLNRILVACGLQRLRSTPRPGLLALLEVAGIDKTQVQSSDLGFRLGPRINARGRLDHAGLAVELMRAADLAEARPMAQVLDAANVARRHLEGETLRQAVARVQEDNLTEHAALVVADASWHPGVLGLVASRLVQRFHRPAVVIGEGGKGSGRSVEGLDLHACLSACHAQLLRFGGHPAAAGVTIDFAQVDDFRQHLGASVQARMGDAPYAPQLRPDAEVEFSCMHLGTVALLEQLEPFGRMNPAILFVAKQQQVQECRRVGENHLKLRLSPVGCGQAGSIDAIAFGMAELEARLPACIDVLFHLERNVFRGIANVQMRIVDVRASDAESQQAQAS